MIHPHSISHRTLYSAAIAIAACLAMLPSPTAATAAQPEMKSGAIAPVDRADLKNDAAFPEPTLRSIPQIEFGAPLDSIASETIQPQTIQPDVIQPEVIQPQIAEVLTSQAEPQPTQPAETQPAASDRFGTTGQRYWYVQGGSAISFDNDDDGFAGMGLVGVGLTEFVGGGHSINAELNGLGFLQPGTDAVGINLTVLSRWHFLRQEDWSLYVDGGAGVMATTSEVPATGSPINFTPQAGIGATFRMRDEDQLMVGLRWHHISNANLYETNPGRDSILLYLGLSQRR